MKKFHFFILLKNKKNGIYLCRYGGCKNIVYCPVVLYIRIHFVGFSNITILGLHPGDVEGDKWFLRAGVADRFYYISRKYPTEYFPIDVVFFPSLCNTLRSLMHIVPLVLFIVPLVLFIVLDHRWRMRM